MVDGLIREVALFPRSGGFGESHPAYVLRQEGPIDLNPLEATAPTCSWIEDDKVAVH